MSISERIEIMCLHRLHWLLKVILDWLFDFFAMNLYFDINSGSIARSNLNCVQTKYLLAAFVFYAHVHCASPQLHFLHLLWKQLDKSDCSGKTAPSRRQNLDMMRVVSEFWMQLTQLYISWCKSSAKQSILLPCIKLQCNALHSTKVQPFNARRGIRCDFTFFKFGPHWCGVGWLDCSRSPLDFVPQKSHNQFWI